MAEMYQCCGSLPE